MPVPPPGPSAGLGRWTWGWRLALVYGIAAGARLAFLDGPLVGEEALGYAAARLWGGDPANLTPHVAFGSALWWRRPLFGLAMAPGAALGLTAYRAEHALLAAALPVVAAVAARRAGARPWLALGAGLALALHPTLVQWGSRVAPDPLMAAFALGGLAAWQGRRSLLAAGLLLAACWTKEPAILLALGLLAVAAIAGRRRGEVRAFPLELDRPTTALLACVLLAPLPLAWSAVVHGGAIPPETAAPSWGWAAALVGGALLVPVVALGLLPAASRPWSAAALAVAAAQALLPWPALRDGPAAVLPLALAAVAIAAAVEPALRHASAGVRQGARAGAAVLVALVVVLAVVPDTVASKAAATPGSPAPPSLGQLAGLRDDGGLAGAVAALRPEQWSSVLVVDVPWTALHHPFAERAGHVGWALTTLQAPISAWVGAIDSSDATVLHVEATPMNEALRRVYADCVQATAGEYVVFDAANCHGRQEALQREVGEVGEVGEAAGAEGQAA